MNVLLGVFLFGCFVTATVALGLLFAMSALAPDGPGAFEGRAEGNEPDRDVS